MCSSIENEDYDKVVSVQGDSWAQLVKILVFPSPTSYMLGSSGFSLLI